MPWLVQQSFECLISVGLFFIQLVSGHKFSFLQVISFLAYLMISSYFIYSVLSHYILLRRMDKNSAQVISSVMEGKKVHVDLMRANQSVLHDLQLYRWWVYKFRSQLSTAARGGWKGLELEHPHFAHHHVQPDCLGAGSHSPNNSNNE